jgi:hypothetical protein
MILHGLIGPTAEELINAVDHETADFSVMPPPAAPPPAPPPPLPEPPDWEGEIQLLMHSQDKDMTWTFKGCTFEVTGVLGTSF